MDTRSWQHRVACLLVVIGGFLLRLYRLGEQSLWYDETVSAYLVSLDIPGLISHTAGDIHPPGYYLFLHLWVRYAGDTEFALAFFSLVFGTLLIPLSYAVARRLMGNRVALWAALVVAVSPYHLWYSQEVRMYTLGAALGTLALWHALTIVDFRRRGAFTLGGRGLLLAPIVGYVLASAVGLYVLYYFAFLLVALNLFVIAHLIGRGRWARLRVWLLAQVAVLALYIPWLPIAWRQATNPPVPPWRGFVPIHRAALEAWSALSLGQSVQPAQVWPLLVAIGALFLVGIGCASGILNRQAWDTKAQSSPNPAALLFTCLFGPLVLMQLASLLSPLYHVRYLFTYAPPFYILVAAGLAWLTRRAPLLAVAGVLALLGGSAFSIHQFYTNPRYAADDLRGAVGFIAQRWRPGDAILINTGYAYPGFLYYYPDPIAGTIRLVDYREPAGAQQQPPAPLLLLTGTIDGDPDLGWGHPDSDFYATTEAETTAGLSRVGRTHPRSWMLRIYDTVTDPDGVIRGWLPANMVPFEDQFFAGQSFPRVQGFMSSEQPSCSPGTPVPLDAGITLLGWQVPPTASAGTHLDVVLCWQVTSYSVAESPPYAVSLKLWGKRGQGSQEEVYLAAQRDEWPVGSLLYTPDWPVGDTIRHPMRLRLPAGLSPGQYWLDVEMYDPATMQPLLRQDGQGHAIPLAPVILIPQQPL